MSVPPESYPLPYAPALSPTVKAVARPCKTLAEIPHVWDGEILMTTVRGAADLLGVTPQTVRNWLRAGKVPGVRYHAGGTRKWLPVRSLWRGTEPSWYAELLARQRAAAAHATAAKIAAGAAESPSE